KLAVVVEKLNGQRAVEAKLSPQQLDLCARGGLSRNESNRIGGNDTRDKKYDANQTGEGGNKPGDAHKNECDDAIHVAAPLRAAPRARPVVARLDAGMSRVGPLRIMRTTAAAFPSALVVRGSHLLRRSDRAELNALELVRIGAEPLGVVDPQACRLVHNDA